MQKVRVLDILVIFRLDLGQITFNLVKKEWCIMSHESFAFFGTCIYTQRNVHVSNLVLACVAGARKGKGEKKSRANMCDAMLGGVEAGGALHVSRGQFPPLFPSPFPFLVPAMGANLMFKWVHWSKCSIFFLYSTTQVWTLQKYSSHLFKA